MRPHDTVPTAPYVHLCVTKAEHAACSMGLTSGYIVHVRCAWRGCIGQYTSGLVRPNRLFMLIYTSHQGASRVREPRVCTSTSHTSSKRSAELTPL